MKPEIEEHIARIEKAVSEYLDANHEWAGVSRQYNIEEQRQHIVRIGTSILCTKWNIGYPGGSFVEAVVSNNLSESIGRADTINQHALKFYCSLIYNTGFIS